MQIAMVFCTFSTFVISACKASGRKLGDKWRKRVENECFNCECHSEDQAICTKVSFHCPPVNCKEPIVPEGKCCPEPCGKAHYNITGIYSPM